MNSDKQKASKPFCSLAYLAKSTIAINANNGIRIVNGNANNNNNNNSNNNNNNNNDNYNANNVVGTVDSNGSSNGGSNMPHVAETARLKACASPELPTGAAIITTTTTMSNGKPMEQQIKSDYFGDINEEQPPHHSQQTQPQHHQHHQHLQQQQQQKKQQQQQQLQRQRQRQRQLQKQRQQQQQQRRANNNNNSNNNNINGIADSQRPWLLNESKLTKQPLHNDNDDDDDDTERNANDHQLTHNDEAVVGLDNDYDEEADDNDDDDDADQYEDDIVDDDADNDLENCLNNEDDDVEDDEDSDDDDDDEEAQQQRDYVDGCMARIPASLIPKHAHGHAFAHNQPNHHHHHLNHHHHQTQNGSIGGGGGGGGLHSCLTSLQSRLSSLDCWDYTIELECLKGPQDLQLAAELGKTLLERNKELEILLKEHKTNNEEQEREIVHLRKQINAMSEVNDSRLKVYEQLEVGIQDLERTNHRLNVEKTRDKKQIKALTHSIETLESRYEELTKQLEETRQTLSGERRKNERLLQERNNARANQLDDSIGGGGGGGARLHGIMLTKQSPNGNEHESGYNANSTQPENCSFSFDQRNKANSTGLTDSLSLSQDQSIEMGGVGSCGGVGIAEDNEELVKLVNTIESTKRAHIAEQQRCSELEEQLVAIIQENQTLQSRLAQTSANEEMMSMHDEFSILDEVRQGQMCSRCLRAVEDRATNNDEASSVAPTEDADEEDERSLLGLEGVNRDNDNASEIGSQAGYQTVGGGNGSISGVGNNGANGSGMSIKINPRAPDSLDLNAPASPNPYRDLVEKYEALLEVQRSSIARKSGNGNGNGNGGANNSGSGDVGGVGMSLADEFQMSGDFNQTQKLMFQAAAAVVNAQVGGVGVGIVDDVVKIDCSNVSGNAVGVADGASSCNDSINTEPASTSGKPGKSVRGRTPTEYSEAETSSSGYSDETSNKCTQTDERPGYFLCSIGDGDDCKFSIYDDISPIDSRFRNRPEYRELFKEIFAVLKKAAENKEEGDKLPLLDDDTNAANAVAAAAAAAAATTSTATTSTMCGGATVCGKVPPVTPANEELPVDFGDDTQSIISSAVSEQSFAMSECITKLERKTAKKHIIESRNQENKPPMSASIAQLAPTTATGGVSVGAGVGVGAAAVTIVGGKQIIENGRVLTPFKREPLEYLSIGVGIKKKNRRKSRTHNSGERVDSPLALPTPPRFFVTSSSSGSSGSGRRGRKDFVPMSDMPSSGTVTPTSSTTGGATGRAGRSSVTKYEWNGTPMVIYNRNLNAARGQRNREFEMSGVEYRLNTVSQEFHKLKKLDLSYAEVLRRADACEHHHQQQRAQRQQQQRRRTGNNVNNSHHQHH